MAKSFKCRVPLSQPLSLVCARCNPCHGDGEDNDDDDDCDNNDDEDDDNNDLHNTIPSLSLSQTD